MAKIKIDIDALQSNMTALETRITELQNLNTRLENLITRIQSSWEGQSSEMYIAKISAQAAKAKKMVAVLQEYKKYVESTIKKFSAADGSNATRIKGSF